MAGKPNKNAIYLTDDEYNTLSSLSKKKSRCKTLKCRCHVLMDLDNNHGKRLTYSQSARANGVCPATVSNITKLYRDGGIDAVISLKRNV
ncbi:helix-turn-helix domain-containing protein, partial [Butyrivibrio sp. WCE2006]|uniref:helix-turn-helix domain-containing protein n=1 Tax=Butyrivibrio sp. WCE2006 TaxID=1410611 RepID=UPI0005D28BE8